MTDSRITRRQIPRKQLPEFGLKPPKDTVYVNVYSVTGNDGQSNHYLTEAEAIDFLAQPCEVVDLAAQPADAGEVQGGAESD